MNISKLHKAKSLLLQAMNTTSVSNHTSVLEAKKCMQQAIDKLNLAEDKHHKSRSKESQFQKWWGNIQSGVANSPMSAVAQQMTLAQLNGMIAQEQKKIDDLEKEIELDLPDELLSD